ncbi:MAG: hypothetical protein AAGA58_13250 [Verrucomicrobiota bacterium]
MAAEARFSEFGSLRLPPHPIGLLVFFANRHSAPVLLGALLCLTLSGCVNLRPEKENQTPGEQTAPTVNTKNQTKYLIGRITFVHTERPFVLIRVGMLPGMQPGEVWEIQRGSIPIGQLNPSGERKGNSIAADILSGDPQVGDLVVYRGAKRTEPPQKRKGLLSKYSDRRDAKKRSKALRKAAAERRKFESANSWSNR